MSVLPAPAAPTHDLGGTRSRPSRPRQRVHRHQRLARRDRRWHARHTPRAHPRGGVRRARGARGGADRRPRPARGRRRCDRRARRCDVRPRARGRRAAARPVLPAGRGSGADAGREPFTPAWAVCAPPWPASSRWRTACSSTICTASWRPRVARRAPRVRVRAARPADGPTRERARRLDGHVQTGRVEAGGHDGQDRATCGSPRRTTAGQGPTAHPAAGRARRRRGDLRRARGRVGPDPGPAVVADLRASSDGRPRRPRRGPAPGAPDRLKVRCRATMTS